MTPLIELRGIGKRYGTGEAAFVALHDIDLTINEGGSWPSWAPRARVSRPS